MANKGDMFDLDFYLDSIEELLKETMGNTLCTPHEVSLIGSWAERVLQKAKGHGRLASKMPFSVDPTCLPSSTTTPSPYPAFRAERMLRLSKEIEHNASSSRAPASVATAAPHRSNTELRDSSALSVSCLQSSTARTEMLGGVKYYKYPSQKPARSEIQVMSKGQNSVSMSPDLMGSRKAPIKAGVAQKIPKNLDGISKSVIPGRASLTKAEKNRIKLISTISSWDSGGGYKRELPEIFDPMNIFLQLENAARVKEISQSTIEWTAFQITTMIASLGSSEAVIGCRKIITRLRDFDQLSSLPNQQKHPRSFVTSYMPLSSPMENLEKLAPRFFQDVLNLPDDHDFEYRHYVAQFCRYMILARNALKRENREMSAEQAMAEVYAAIVTKMKPKTARFRNGGVLNPGFKAHQVTLERKILRGFRWFELANRFGIGILALYQPCGKYGRSADLTIDTQDLKDEEFQLLIDYLDAEGNADFQWLKRICGLIGPYMEEGLNGRLRLPMLNMEHGTEDQVLSCNERSEELARMLMPIQSIRNGDKGPRAATPVWRVGS